jgi:hypothetical protein
MEHKREEGHWQTRDKGITDASVKRGIAYVGKTQA